MPTLEEHRKNLERYRVLLEGTRDSAVRDMLKRLIEETRAAIREIDADRHS